MDDSPLFFSFGNILSAQWVDNFNPPAADEGLIFRPLGRFKFFV